MSDTEAMATADLIAAAPDLYEALKLHVAKSGHTAGCTMTSLSLFGCSKRCQQTRAALAKARGEEAPK